MLSGTRIESISKNWKIRVTKKEKNKYRNIHINGRKLLKMENKYVILKWAQIEYLYVGFFEDPICWAQPMWDSNTSTEDSKQPWTRVSFALSLPIANPQSIICNIQTLKLYEKIHITHSISLSRPTKTTKRERETKNPFVFDYVFDESCLALVLSTVSGLSADKIFEVDRHL